MRFHECGFLSPDIEGWTASLRQEHSVWFDLVERINQMATSALWAMRVNTADRKQLFGSILYGRTIQTAQAAILIAQRGMPADARGLARNATESVIALAAVAHKDGETFFAELASGHYKGRLSLMNSLIANRESREVLGDDAEERFAEVRAAAMAEVGEPRDIKWANIAARVGMDGIYDTIYRSFSNDGAHVSLDSMIRYIVTKDDNDGIECLSFEPRSDDIESLLSALCSVMLSAMDIVAGISGSEALATSTKMLAEQWGRLALKGEVPA